MNGSIDIMGPKFEAMKMLFNRNDDTWKKGIIDFCSSDRHDSVVIHSSGSQQGSPPWSLFLSHSQNWKL